MDLTIILTAHNEGYIAHKTMLSLKEALEELTNSGKKYEILIHLDNVDSNTEEYFSRYKNDENIVIFHNSFGDLGLSRNFCIKKARGKYIMTLDADDLISKEFIINGLARLEEAGENSVVLHPEYCISFRKGLLGAEIWKMNNSSKSSIENAKALLTANRWISVAFSSREVFMRFPYREAKDGFGFEDYMFNIDTVDAGIAHEVVPNSSFFYRRKNISLNSITANKNVAMPYSSLFSVENFKSVNVPRKRLPISRRLKAKYVHLRENSKIANMIIEPLAFVGKKVLRKSPKTKKHISDEILTQWKKAGQIEFDIFPTKQRLDNILYYVPESCGVIAESYISLAREIPHEVDYVFVVPWLKVSGAEKVLLNYLNAFLELRPDLRVAIITTIPNNNVQLDRIPKNAFLIDFGAQAADLRECHKDALFTKLIIQLGSPRIHIINSILAYKWVSNHMELVKKNFKLDVSVFCFEYLPGTNMEAKASYANPWIADIYSVVDKIYTDNKQTKLELMQEEGFTEEKIFVQYQPLDGKAIRVNSRRLNKILWAGRISPQKNPEILASIISLLSKNIEIDVYGAIDNNYAVPDFNNSRVHYKGAFSKIDDISMDDYGLFLYTSLTDGLPNILLEIAQRGLPIIAPNVGGISDFIRNDETGVLIDDPMNAEEYAEGIEKLLKNRKLRERLTSNALQLLKTQHSWKTYVETIKKDMDL